MPGAALAGNEEGVLFGSTAEMSAGAVTATVSDGSSLYYNPAGLASAPTQQLDLSGTGYVLRSYNVPTFLRTPSGPSAPVSALELMSVSAAVTFVRRLSSSVAVGVGLFTPWTQDYSLRSTLQAGPQVNWFLGGASTRSTYQVVAGLGATVQPRVRVGAGLVVTYDALTSSAITQVADSANMLEVESSAVNAYYSRKRAGLGANLGVQWQPIDALAFGLSVRPPGATVYYSEATDGTVSGAQHDPSTGRLVSLAMSAHTDNSGFEFTSLNPLRFRFGMAVIQPRFTLSLDGDVAMPLAPAHSMDRALSVLWNVRVGALWRVAERVRMGAGLFTDRAAARVAVQGYADYYGGTVGAELSNLHLIRNESRALLTLTTALSLRYAYGYGYVGGLQVSPTSIASAQVEANLVVHDVAVYLSTAFRF